jgi:SNF2 family DNA or RNA helicase
MERRKIDLEKLTDEELNKLLESGQLSQFSEPKPDPKKKIQDPKKGIEQLTDDEFEKLLAEGKLSDMLPEPEKKDDLTEEELKFLEEEVELPVLSKRTSSVREEEDRMKKSGGKDFIKGIKGDVFMQNSKKIDYSSPKSYLKSIPLEKANKSFQTIKINPMNIFYFRLGHNPVYTESFLVLVPGLGGKPSEWYDLESMEAVKVDKKLSRWEAGIKADIAEEVMSVGWLVINQHIVGFALSLDSLAEAYKGIMTDTWKKLLKNEFCSKMIENFAFHFEDKDGEEERRYEIPNTDCDFPLPDWYVPFNDRLFLHQKQEVGWMFRREAEPYIYVRKKLNSLSFLDTGYFYEADSLNLGFLDLSNSNGTHSRIMIQAGILASEVGSGKTVSCIALTTIGKDIRIPDEKVEESKKDKKEIKKKLEKFSFYEEDNEEEKLLREQYDMNLLLENGYKPSLVIVTKNILHQWAQEFKEFAPGIKTVCIETSNDFGSKLTFKNINKNKSVLENCDVILTHRDAFSSLDLSTKGSFNWLTRVIFSRVMLDEFHEISQGIKSTYAKFAANLSQIQRNFTWGITGTPDNLDYYKNTGPLFNLLKLDKILNSQVFIKIKSEFVLKSMRKNPQSVRLPRLNCKIRRVQFGHYNNLLYKGKLRYCDDKVEAQKLCSYMLPQWKMKDQIIEEITVKVFDFIDARLDEEVQELQAAYTKTKDQRLLMRIENLKSENSFYGSVRQLTKQDLFECPICITELKSEQMVITDCLHYMCSDCFDSMKKTLMVLSCPVCRNQFSPNDIIVNCKPKDIKETKLSALVDEINRTPKEDKVIVFTQFHSLVEELITMLVRCGVNFLILRGEPTEINISLNQFKKIPELKVLLMSVEQSASGINVTCANHIFFAHPIFGMSYEKAAVTYKQCVGRAYRIGQGKEVNVQMFVTEDTLEEDMIDCYEKYVVSNVK